MARIQVGPRPNAVSCELDPTRLPPGRIHCNPQINLADRSLRVTGTPRMLKRLMDARFQAQSSGIEVVGNIQGNSIAVTRVIGGRQVTSAPVVSPVVARTVARTTAPLALRALARRVGPPMEPPAEVLFEAEVEGILIQLTARRPGGI